MFKSASDSSTGSRAQDLTSSALPRAGKHPHFESELAALNLDDCCDISDCNSATEELFGYPRSELIGRPISVLFPEFSKVALVRNGEINSRLKFISSIGRNFEGVSSGGDSFACELFLNFLGNPGQHLVSIVIRPAGDGGPRKQ